MKKGQNKTKLKAKFFFYEDFAELLKNLDDKEAGEYIKLLLNFVFDGKEETELNKNNATIMYNLAKLIVKREELQASKNRKHFTFYREYYNIMEILEDEKSGKLIKKICSYMFDKNLIREEDCADILCYFNPMKISLDKSNKKSMATKSRQECIELKAQKAEIKSITLQDIRNKFPTLIEEITSDDIQNLLTSFTAERVRDICKINLSQLFKKAVAQGIIDRNPCDAVEIKKHKEQHKKALTLAEQDKFLAVTKNTPHSLLFRLMLSTGLRIGEALALTKSDIDFENSKLRVNKNVVFVKNKRIVQDTPKSEAGNRTIPIPKDICEELKQVKGEVLFPVTYNAVKLWINKMCAREDMKMTLHTLRHTYATRLEEAGIPAKVKQYLLGHSSLEMTQNTYTDTQEHYIDSLSDKVRAVF